jgi:putative ABC transport system substrate-binding protein
MMSRRVLLTTVAAAIVASPRMGEAQQVGKVWRIGLLLFVPRDDPRMRDTHEAFVDELRRLGYREAENVVFEWRHTGGLNESRRREAQILLQWKPDVVVTSGGVEALILRETTTSLPIVVAIAADMVALGLAASVARPGGSVTGFQMLSADLMAKRLELMRELVPKLDRLGFLYQARSKDGSPPVGPTAVAAAAQLNQSFADLEAASRPLSINVVRFPAVTAADFDGAFAAMSRGGVQAALAAAGPMLGSHRDRLAEMTLRYRVPVMYETKPYVEAGSLISYGVRPEDGYRTAARYVDKILKGSKPGDLPIEQPRQFEMVINLKTAKALGLTIPQSILLRADRVIQ